MNPVRVVDDKFQSEPNASASSGGTGGDSAESRLARLETRVEYLATKEDIQKIKVWVLGGVIGGIVFSAAVAIGILKLLG